MKILYLHHGTVLGGAPLSLLYLVREVERQPNLKVTLACHSSEMQQFFSRNLQSAVQDWTNPCTFFGRYFIGYVPLDTSERRRLFFRELLRVPRSIFQQYRRIRKLRPDIVHINSSVMFTSAVAARLAGAKLVWHVREPVQGEPWKQKLSGWFIQHLAHKIITISEVEAKRLGADRFDKIRVIYNPINMENLRSELFDSAAERQKLGFSATDKLVVTLGGVTPRKGALEQVEAMQYVDDSVKLIMAGPPLLSESTDAYHQKIHQVLKQLPPGKVTFVGLLENIAPLLVAADVLTFTGMTPHFPRPVFEAWLMKKPVVVFDMEGISNQVANGSNGMVVTELSGRALGAALAAVFKDPLAMQKMGEVGRLKAQERCNPLSVAQQVVSVYREIVG
jgi:glycosyltransferase involved in cell wall biosynthesis